MIDVNPKSQEVRAMDLTRLQFADSSFDIVLCNHVLEHIPHDNQAWEEIFRVLRSGGWAVLQTPYCPDLQCSFSDLNLNTDALRLRYYGQEDHVRRYGLDLFDKIEATGFGLQRISHKELLAAMDPCFYGVNEREDLILCRKG